MDKRELQFGVQEKQHESQIAVHLSVITKLTLLKFIKH